MGEARRRQAAGEVPPRISIPEPIVEVWVNVSEAARQDDARWFELNPARSYRVRRRYPDEWTGVEPVACPLVAVCQHKPGVRMKYPFGADGEVPNNEPAARRAWDAAHKAFVARVKGWPQPQPDPWVTRAQPERADA